MKGHILTINSKKICSKSIGRAAELLRNGGVVAFPTETVYGLGANVFDSYAVARIFEIKNRPRFDPLIIHINAQNDIRKLCRDVDTRAHILMKKFWPGPLTLLLPKSDLVPSANPFGYLSPTTAQHVREQLGKKVDMILDGGRCLLGIESTIIDLTGSEPALLRPGGLPVEEVEQTIGEVKKSTINAKKPNSPGQLPCHYAPSTPIKILRDKKNKMSTKEKIGLLAFTPTKEPQAFEMVEILSSKWDLREAAANLFSCLHRLDTAGLDVIYAEPVPESGLGRAIMDMLQRASAKNAAH